MLPIGYRLLSFPHTTRSMSYVEHRVSVDGVDGGGRRRINLLRYLKTLLHGCNTKWALGVQR